MDGQTWWYHPNFVVAIFMHPLRLLMCRSKDVLHFHVWVNIAPWFEHLTQGLWIFTQIDKGLQGHIYLCARCSGAQIEDFQICNAFSLYHPNSPHPKVWKGSWISHLVELFKLITATISYKCKGVKIILKHLTWAEYCLKFWITIYCNIFNSMHI